MGHSHASEQGPILFCQRNNRLWVTVLIASAVVVLALAAILAYEDGKFIGWAHGQPHASSAGLPSATGAAPQASVAPGRQVALTGSAPPASGAAAGQPPSGPGVVAGNTSPATLQASFNQVAAQVRPCVVSIHAIRSSPPGVQAANSRQPQFANPFDGVPDKVIGGVAFESVGSGIIIDPRGYVVTNEHLIAGADSIMLEQFQSSQALPATIVASDPVRDLSLLKIKSDGPFPAAKLANSDEVQVGDWVVAIGNPFGLGHTVTAGIISSRRSSIQIGGVTYKNLLQTDAPINQGSSGGPLVNLQARVVGINTAIYAPTGVFNGTGFAIPSNQVGAFVSRVAVPPAAPAEIARGSTPALPGAGAQTSPAPRSGGRLGISASDVSPALAAKIRLDRAQGVFVNGVDAGSPAENGGLRRGDVIVEVAGVPIADSMSLDRALGTLPAGATARVVVQRDGERVERDMALGASAQQGTPAAGLPSRSQ